MSSQIKRTQVEWERASCRGLDTEMFYKMRTELLEDGLGYNNLRRICFECPIQRECLQIGTSLERYGFWGGLSEEERTAIYENRDGKVMFRLKRDLQLIGMKYQPIAEVVLSVKRVYGLFDYTERMKIERPIDARATDTTIDGDIF